MKKLFSFILVICTFALLLCAVSPTLAVASLDENKNLPKTGTTYETAAITFMYRSEDDATRDFEIVKSEIPEFKDIVKSREPLVAKGELEVRYASLFSVSQEEAREYGYKKYQGVINNLVSLAKKQGIMLSPDLDDLKLQAFAKQQFLSTEDAAVISFVKFIDIYENYAYNNEMRKLVIELEGKVFKSIDELMSDESLSTLLNMMPVTIRGTAEHGTDEENDKNSETGLPGYNANNAVSYASSWRKKKYACHTSDQYEATGKSLSTIYNNCEAVWIYKVG